MTSNDQKNIAKPYGGGGDKVNFIVTHPKSSDPLSFPTLLVRNDWSIRFVDDNK